MAILFSLFGWVETYVLLNISEKYTWVRGQGRYFYNLKMASFLLLAYSFMKMFGLIENDWLLLWSMYF